MKWSFIALADFHMSNNLPYAQPTTAGRTDRLEDQLDVWKQVHAAAKRYDVDSILFLGDLFDKSKVDPVTLTHTVEAIMKTEVNLCILPGNHDANSIRGGRFAVEAFREMKNELVEVIGEKPGQSLEVEMDGAMNLCLWPLAFSPVTQTEEELKLIRENADKNDFNILLAHNSIMGAHHLGWKCDDGLDPRQTCNGFEMVLAGHFHENQELDSGKGGGPHYQYLGAPMHHDFSDVGRNPCIWLYEFEDEPKGGLKIDVTKIPIKAPEFYVIQFGDDPPSNIKRGDFLRIEVQATHAEWASKRRAADVEVAQYKDDGVRASHMHKPIYHHKSRIKATTGGHGDSFSLEKAVNEYVETTDVATIGLDEKKLKALGMEALSAARSEHGTA